MNRRNAGYTLVEMLIAMAVMLIILGGVFQAFNPSQGAFITQPEVADMQQRLRVGVSAMTVQRDAAQETIARCKQAGLTVVAGGPLFVAEHEQFSAVDHFVLNEAETRHPPPCRPCEVRPGRRTFPVTAYLLLAAHQRICFPFRDFARPCPPCTVKTLQTDLYKCTGFTRLTYT